ncbi:MAG: UDP-N-acetylmuramoyl-L-alanyl-D-glutamate--2,6-diaminopimelate ligase [Thermaerobacter sp.]|nr:UDP-N-acetylmuramoyl-L-alanyl-D-glutamate--2,6-diaminopimelate ligase [Thermaerobacter sp.]
MATFNDLLQAVRAGSYHGKPVIGVTDRSFDVRPGFVFVARPGQRVDGSQYAHEAVQRGALAVVAEAALSLGAPVVTVESAAEALGRLAAAVNGEPSQSLKMLGITGTNGKTTTAALVSSALQAAGHRVGTIGTLGVQLDGEMVRHLDLTTPAAPELQAALRELRDYGATHAVMEVSSHALRQGRTAGCSFDAGVFTNLTRDHTDYHGDMQHYLEAKGLLFEGLGGQGRSAVAVLNSDSPAFEYLRSVTKVPIRTFGKNADVSLVSSEDLGLSGSRVTLRIDGERHAFSLLLPGPHNVENAMAAAAAVTSLGVPAAVALRGLSDLQRVKGRLQVIEDIGRPYRIVIDYAHNPAGLVQLLRLARRASRGRVIAVFGGRGERDRGKRPLMGAIAAALADHLIVTVDNPRSEGPKQTAEEVAVGARESGVPTEVVLDRYEAIRRAMALAGAGDTITISGKGGEVWDEQHEGREMTDEQVVREIAAES